MNFPSKVWPFGPSPFHPPSSHVSQYVDLLTIFSFSLFLTCLLPSSLFLSAEEVGDRWGTAVREREYYKITSLPIPKHLVIESRCLRNPS